MIEPGQKITIGGTEVSVEREFRKAFPFSWYQTSDATSGVLLAQVLHERFADVLQFRSAWDLRAKALANAAHVPITIDSAYEQGAFAIALYRPFSTDPPAGAVPGEIAATLFQELAGIHRCNEFIGALADEGVAFGPTPRLYDLSVVPLFRFTPPALAVDIVAGFPHISPTVRQTRQSTVAGDLYAVASWLMARFPELGPDPTLRAVVEGAGSADAWTAAQVARRLSPTFVGTPDALSPVPSLDEDHDTENFEDVWNRPPAPTNVDSPPAEASTPDAPPSAQVPPSLPKAVPRPRPDRTAAPDMPLGVAQAKLAATIVALAVVSVVISRWVADRFIAPMIPTAQEAAKSSGAERDLFEKRLRWDQSHH